MKYAIVREFLYGWDFTEFDGKGPELHDSWKEATDSLTMMINDVNDSYAMGYMDEPYQEDCMVVRVEENISVEQPMIILKQFTTKGELVNLVFGSNSSKVDSAFPIDYMRDGTVKPEDQFFYCMDYNENTVFGKLTDVRELVNIAYTYDE